MSKICPNCMHTVRSGANYCGYCGTSLIPTPRNPTPIAQLSSRDPGKTDEGSIPQRQPNHKHAEADRSWVKFPMMLLFLVIMLALTVRYWPEILTFLGQTIPLLRLS
jgi:hypothetical protein